MACYHVRSSSLPSRPHPAIPEFNVQLCRLRASEASSSSRSASISCKLNGLQDLLDCVDRLLLLPLNEQALSQEKNQKIVDRILDGLLRLLDVCNVAKDALLQTKESTQELQSIVRRRRSGATELPSEVKKFMNSRKLVKKAIHKAIVELKGIEISSFNKDNKRPKSQSKSFIFNIMQPKRIVEESQLNEFARLDASLNLFISPKMKKSDRSVVENAQNQLEELESCIQDLEEGLKSLFRRLIKARVSLLNILSH